MKLFLYLLPTSALFGQIITTFAGAPKTFFSNTGLIAAKTPIAPSRLAVGPKNEVYFGDREANIVWRLDADGTLTVVAGNGLPGFSGDGGPATAASLNQPAGFAVDGQGNLYIADVRNSRIRKVDTNGIITTVAGTGQPGYSGDGGPAASARISYNGSLTYTTGGHTPAQYEGGIAADRSGNLYIPDLRNNVIRKVGTDGIITTVAGTGSGSSQASGDGGPAIKAVIPGPFSAAVDAAGNLYIGGPTYVRKVDLSGTISLLTTVYAVSLTVDKAGSLYASTLNEVLQLTPSTRVVAGGGNPGNGGIGDGGPATAARLMAPFGVAVDSQGGILISDSFNERIRKVDAAGTIHTMAGSGAPGYFGDGGPAASAGLSAPNSVAIDRNGNVYIADTNNQRIRKVDTKGTITTFADFSVPSYNGNRNPTYLAIAPDGGVLVNAGPGISKIAANGSLTTVVNSSQLNGLVDFTSDPSGNIYYIDSNLTVRKIDPSGNTTTPAGGVLATCTAFLHRCITTDSAGNVYFPGPGNAIANSLAKLTPAGMLTTIRISGVSQIAGMAVDVAGNIYLSDVGAHDQVVKVAPDGATTPYAGNNGYGLGGDGGPAVQATLFGPVGLAVDPAGNLFIADNLNGRIREVLTPAAFLSYQVSPPSLTFSAAEGGPPPSVQTVNLTPSVAGLTFTAASDSPWLSINPAGGTMPTAVQVSVDPSALAAGNYKGTITITAPSAASSVTAIPVALTVQSPAPPKLNVNPTAVTLSTLLGAGNQTSQIQIANSGGGSLSFSATAATISGGAWLSVTPASGTVMPGSPATLTVTASLAGLTSNTYQGNITIAAAGSTVVVPVVLLLTAPKTVILLSQTGLSFRASAGGGAPLPQSFGILNSGQGSMPWTATVSSLPTGSSWLSIDQQSGTVATPFTDVSFINVSVNPAGLAAGDYYGSIQVKSNAANSPQQVTVILTVLPAGTSPGPEVRPSGVIFTGAAGASPGSQDVLVGNPKAQADTYISGGIGKGFSYLPATAALPPGQPLTVRVFPDFTSLAPGEIDRGTITLQFSDGTPRTISVLTVVAPGSSGGGSTRAEDQQGCTTLLIQPTNLTDPSSSVTVGQPAALEVKVADSCGHLITQAAVTAGFSNRDPVVNLVHVGGGKWTGTWTPRNTSQSRVTITFTALLGQGAQQLLSGTVNVPVALQTGATTPLTSGTANAASYAGTYIAPGGLVAIFGQQLAGQTDQPSQLPFPTLDKGTQVLLGGIPLPLRYVSGTQINAQVPFDLAPNTQQQLVVKSGSAQSVPQDVVVAVAQPGIYTVDSTGQGAGIIVDGISNQPITLSNPAQAGQVVTIYCTGLGAVSPPVATGSPAPSSGSVSQTVNPVMVTIGGVDAPVQFAGLTPGSPDLYQVNAVVPAGVQSGNAAVVLSVAGQSSADGVTVSVR